MGSIKSISKTNSIAVPLSNVIQKKASETVRWYAECEKAFSTLKEKLTAKLILQVLDLSKPFTLQTDASNIGIGATLLQEGRGDPNLLYSIACSS